MIRVGQIDHSISAHNVNYFTVWCTCNSMSSMSTRHDSITLTYETIRFFECGPGSHLTLYVTCFPTRQDTNYYILRT